MTLPDPNSPDYTPTLVYKARAYIALNDPSGALDLIPSETEDVSLQGVAALARYVGAPDESLKDAALEELRDLCVEIEGEDSEAEQKEKDMVKVLAGTAFARAGEVEEALETLGAGTSHENLEAYVPTLLVPDVHSSDDMKIISVALIVQIYLSISRPDLARKELERAKRWAEDDVLLQLIEASIALVTGKDGYNDPHSFYTEQLANPSLTSPHLLTARGVTRLLMGEVSGAKSDFEEAVSQLGGKPDAETLAAMTVAAGLGPAKQIDVEQYWRCVSVHYRSRL